MVSYVFKSKINLEVFYKYFVNLTKQTYVVP